MDSCRQSLIAQHKLLNAGGIALHALWYGSDYEEFEGLGFQQYTRESFADLLDDRFEILETRIYTEMEKDDSIAFVLKRIPV